MTDARDDRGGRVLYVVSQWLPEDRLAEWNAWHTAVHMPAVVARPEMRRARKYRVTADNHPADWTPQYVTVYELDSLAAWERYNASPEAAALRQDHTDRYGAEGKISRQLLVLEADVTEDGRGAEF